MITLSIGIPSKNRPISLFRCLSSIKKEDNLIYEIIVSNDSERKYQNIYQKICEKFKVKIVSGPKKGLYANHNKLYSICSGSHLRIVDDDHTFPKDHFKKCIESIRKYPEEVLSYGEAYPENLNKIFLPGELNSRGFSSIPRDYSSCAALSSGASVFPKIKISNIREIEIYPFGMTWLEFGKRLQKNKINIRVLDNTHVIHHYDESNRSINSKDLILETTFFVMIINNLIYEKKLINYVLMIYEMVKKLIDFNIIKNIKLFLEAYKKYKKLKYEKIWDFS